MSDRDDLIESEATVFCISCYSFVPLSDCIETGDEHIGPDLIPHPVYLCFKCAEEIDLMEDGEMP